MSAILDQIAAGDPWDKILKGYPELDKEDIPAALLYAGALLDHTEVMEVRVGLFSKGGLGEAVRKRDRELVSQTV